MIRVFCIPLCGNWNSNGRNIPWLFQIYQWIGEEGCFRKCLILIWKRLLVLNKNCVAWYRSYQTDVLINMIEKSLTIAILNELLNHCLIISTIYGIWKRYSFKEKALGESFLFHCWTVTSNTDYEPSGNIFQPSIWQLKIFFS